MTDKQCRETSPFHLFPDVTILVLLSVFALFFLEHGLSWEEFGILNGIWAISIILLEVPSGALADNIGRKRLIVIAALCMVIEMLALLIAPMHGAPPYFFLPSTV